MTFLVTLVLLIWAISFFCLKGEDLSPYDSPVPTSMSGDAPASAGVREAEQLFEQMGQQGEGDLGGAMITGSGVQKMRAMMDEFGKDVAFDGEIIPVDANGIKGEWLVPPGADMSVRMLYIHGGAFVVGSPLSHRAITTYYANMLGAPVFSLDYRMSPEFKRRDTIDDCRFAYRWILQNSPEGKSEPATVFVSGDSAGGNLALLVSAWTRNVGLRMPNAVVALSPATDLTMSGPSFKANVATDKMLGPALSKLTWMPQWLFCWISLVMVRTSPSNPEVSPVADDLSGLPPTLVHASEVEMLRDDAIRYANKARASGSPVEIQTWNHVMHVWHMFHEMLPEGKAAMAEIESFLSQHRADSDQEQAA